MKLSSVEKKALRSSIYKLRKLKDFLLSNCDKNTETNRKFVAKSCIKSVSGDFDRVLHLFECGNIRDFQIYLRIMFEMNLTLNYLMLNCDDEINLYQNHSLLINYKDLVLYLHHNILCPDARGKDDKSILINTIKSLKSTILESGSLEKLGCSESFLEPENITKLTSNLKATFRKTYFMKEELKAYQEFNGISIDYFAHYNLPSQVIHGHWYNCRENLFGNAVSIFDYPLNTISFLATHLRYLATGMRNANLIDSVVYTESFKQLMSIINTKQEGMGLSPLNTKNFEAKISNSLLVLD